jgi:hypothetical protein
MTGKILFTSATLFLFILAGAGAEQKTYFVKPGDTLEGIAVAVYSALPGKEPVDADNAARAYLIYQVNRERLKLTMVAADYGTDPSYPVEPDMELLIPIQASYPNPSSLAALARKELVNLKAREKKASESVKVRDTEGKRTDEITEAVFSLDFNGSLSLSRVDYARPPYLMSDGTVLPPGDSGGLDLYVWQVLEHANAKKTVVIFPDSGRSPGAAYGKFEWMQWIADPNPGKQTAVMLESIDPDRDGNLLGEFGKIKDNHPRFDAFKALSIPVGLNPSMAFFYLRPGTLCLGLEDKDILGRFTERRAFVAKQVEDEFDRYRKRTLGDFYRFFPVHTELLVAKLENDIRKSVRAKKPGREAAELVNGLEREFAALYLDPGFLDMVLARYGDDRIPKVLNAIDGILACHTAVTFEEYRKTVAALRDEFIAPETVQLLKEYRDTRTRDLNRQLYLERDQAIAVRFAALPENTLAFCELGLGHIYNQISLCLEKKNYNLVVFYHPALAFDASAAPEPVAAQDPDTHARVLLANPLSAGYFNGLTIPPSFRETYESDAGTRLKIDTAYALLKDGDFSAQDGLMGDRKCFIDARYMPGTGVLLRLHTMDGDTPAVRHYFINGASAAEQASNMEKLAADGSVPERDRQLLALFAQLYLAGRNL